MLTLALLTCHPDQSGQRKSLCQSRGQTGRTDQGGEIILSKKQDKFKIFAIFAQSFINKRKEIWDLSFGLSA